VLEVGAMVRRAGGCARAHKRRDLDQQGIGACNTRAGMLTTERVVVVGLRG